MNDYEVLMDETRYRVNGCVCSQDSDFSDLNDPKSSFALAKAVFVALGVISSNIYDSGDGQDLLPGRLENKFGAGVELALISDLPAGSGN